MNGVPLLRRALVPLLGSALFANGLEAMPMHSIETRAEAKASAPAIAIRNEQGLLKARIGQVPLGKVLRELAKQTEAHFHPLDPAIVNQPVTAVIDGMPLYEGIRELLKGFSYLIYEDGDSVKGLGIIVLSTAFRSDGTGPSPGGVQHVVRRPVMEPPAEAADPGKPHTLEEFRPIAGEAQDPDLVRADSDLEIMRAKQQEQEEAFLLRALEVLQSDHKQLHPEAIQQLASIKDPRATQVLIEAARDTSDGEIRAQAVESLWLHASELQFADAAANNVLKDLANNEDSPIGQLARHALQEMQHVLDEKAAN